MAQDDLAVDPSHDLDMVSLYSSQTVDSEIEADVLRGILDANDIPSILVRTPYPPLGIDLRVPRAHLQEAERLIEEARAAGPAAADEAEANSEK